MSAGLTTHAALACADLTVTLGETEILTDIDLEIPQGQWATIIGPNGAGKTTLLRCLAGLLAHEGTVELGGDAISGLSTRQRARQIAIVPQTPEVPVSMAVFDYIMMGRTSHQGFGLGASKDDQGAVGAVLARLDLRGFARRRLDSLSGGELQRAVIARALAQDASIVLFDEPTSALDIGHQLEVLELIEELRQERGLTVVSTLHDLSLAGQFAERIVMLSDGRVVADGSPQRVLTEETLERYYGATVEVSADDRGVAIIVRRNGVPK